MDITTLILAMAALLGVLFVLVLLYTSKGRSPKSEPVSPSLQEPYRAAARPRTFDELEAVILDRKSSKEQLRDASAEIGSRFARVYATTLGRYSHIIVALCRHPKTDKDIVVAFDRALREANPNLRQELDAALQKGLNSR